jgi:hypothetical protein
MPNGKFEYSGGCHCGALSVRYLATAPSSAWALRTCSCSFCQAHAAIYCSDPAGGLAFSSADPDALLRYRFGTRTLEFMLCRYCGVYLGARTDPEDGALGVVNVRALRPLPTDLAAVTVINFEAETPAARKARHHARWTPLSSGSL